MSRKKDQLYNPEADGQPAVKTCPLCGPADQMPNPGAAHWVQDIWFDGKQDDPAASVARCRSCDRVLRVLRLYCPDMMSEERALAIANSTKQSLVIIGRSIKTEREPR